jgi:hypothetical protein
MNVHVLADLLRLRYRLLWAQVRTRNGKIAVFLAGYLLVIVVGLLLALGGLGAGIAAVQAGKSELIARIVLGSFFLNATLIAVILGFGMNAAFSDAALRRYPLTSWDRLLARQLTALLEPLWLFIFLLDGALALSLWAAGAGSVLFCLPAALLLVIANYLFARFLAGIVERLLHVRGGPVILMLIIIGIATIPAMAAPSLSRNSALVEGILNALRFTPPFGAAVAMTSASALAAAAGLLILLVWIVVLLALIFVDERHPAVSRAPQKAAASWDSWYDRVAGRFPPDYGPLVGKTLRYYFRSNRARYNYILAVPIMVFLVIIQARPFGPMGIFVWGLLLFAFLGFQATVAIAVNQFGYDDGGFRRYFLLPCSPAAAFRASSLTSLFLGATLIPVGFVVWFALAPLHTDARMFSMMLSSAVGGLLFFNALSNWTSLLAPRRTSLSSTFGNNLSAGANVLLIGGILSIIFLAMYIAHSGHAKDVINFWWAPPLFLIASAIFYAVTLRAGSALFLARRERLLATIEGRGERSWRMR